MAGLTSAIRTLRDIRPTVVSVTGQVHAVPLALTLRGRKRQFNDPKKEIRCDGAAFQGM